jgi:hypothetical protein
MSSEMSIILIHTVQFLCSSALAYVMEHSTVCNVRNCEVLEVVLKSAYLGVPLRELQL